MECVRIIILFPRDIGVKVSYKSVDLKCYYVGCLI